jgi:branched-chain amino acid transport system permease protein
LQAVLNGLALGWIYVLIALGLTFILSIMNILQLAHGEIYMIGAYIVYYLSVPLGLNVYAAIFLGMLIMAVFGIFLEKFLFRPVQGKILPPIIVSTGLTLILTNGAVAAFGLSERTVPRLAEGSLEILGSAVPEDRIIAVAFSLVLLVLVYLFLKKSKYGQAMVASAQDKDAALLRGIDSNQMSSLAFMIGCALAATSGALAGSILELTPFMGTQPLVKGMVIIVLGGLGSLLGATVGGLILGLLDGILPVIFPPIVSSIVPLIIVVVILLVKPQGLFGHE